MKYRITKQRRSAVLILALLLMGAIVGSAISLSTVIVDSSSQTSTLNDFIKASLIADSGLERGLAVVKAGRVDKTQIATKDAAIVTAVVSATNPLAAVTASTPSTDSLAWPRLRPNESATFDVITTTGTAADYTINIQAQLVSPANLACHGDARGQLDISWVGLKNTGEPYYSGRKILTSSQIEQAPNDCTATSQLTHNQTQIDMLSAGNLFDVNGNPLSVPIDIGQTKGFRVKISAVEHTTNLATTTLNTMADTVEQIKVSKQTVATGFPSRINITSTGTFNNSSSLKTASVLWQLPASGVFNYVLFTEGDIIPR